MPLISAPDRASPPPVLGARRRFAEDKSSFRVYPFYAMRRFQNGEFRVGHVQRVEGGEIDGGSEVAASKAGLAERGKSPTEVRTEFVF
mmetsp:Transcript_14832/g.39738  ORF Transcript_14832/g.39738 Transcript_14832/m.39738 type:complete len:88 (+) Transcript_14832:127-390(+)|eukprot:CAMPEP_0184710022 /NCGR_PEP_ID=MMETSP0314-20130426/999_1 /TAXON_ID=38298 /ORGANISM="Rhodella maculata, Strain CCMP 736" /LENGTH=87 /DNA_ID=CAMNT_0027171801 /DNA_START=64 /DNA_END=327 /DNA_ORIENTATION=+